MNEEEEYETGYENAPLGDGDAFSNVAQGLSGRNKAQLVAYWQQAIDTIERIGENGQGHDTFKSTALPLARIKKVMKTDSEVRMISAEAPILFAKGCDIFITELTMRAWIHAEESKRRTLQRSDIATALQKSDMFDFLIDIVPREEAQPRRYQAPPAQQPGSAQAQQSTPAQTQQQHAQVPQGVPQGAPQGVSQGVPQGVSQSVPQGIPQGIPQGVPHGAMPQHAHPGQQAPAQQYLQGQQASSHGPLPGSVPHIPGQNVPSFLQGGSQEDKHNTALTSHVGMTHPGPSLSQTSGAQARGLQDIPREDPQIKLETHLHDTTGQSPAFHDSDFDYPANYSDSVDV